jgi:hypothetical protein
LLPAVPAGARTGLKGLRVLRHRPVLGRLGVLDPRNSPELTRRSCAR